MAVRFNENDKVYIVKLSNFDKIRNGKPMYSVYEAKMINDAINHNAALILFNGTEEFIPDDLVFAPNEYAEAINAANSLQASAYTDDLM